MPGPFVPTGDVCQKNLERCVKGVRMKGGGPNLLAEPVAQDKGEGRMAPKCARPLSGARPSACADAISHLGARAV